MKKISKLIFILTLILCFTLIVSCRSEQTKDNRSELSFQDKDSTTTQVDEKDDKRINIENELENNNTKINDTSSNKENNTNTTQINEKDDKRINVDINNENTQPEKENENKTPEKTQQNENKAPEKNSENTQTPITKFKIPLDKGYRELELNIIEQKANATIYTKNLLVFSREETFINYYATLKTLPPVKDINPGINFDYNLAIAITMGEKYYEGYSVTVDKVLFTGQAVNIYYHETEPKEINMKTRIVNHPYCVAAVHYDKDIRESTRVISFIDSKTGKLTQSAPMVKTNRYPGVEIPEFVRTFQVESGDYGNFTEERYMAFNHHTLFNSTYIDLKENKEYRVIPPELSFLGNMVIIMTLGEKKDGGYKVLSNGAYTNVYLMGDSLYVMVKKIEPTENTIRYYETTRPYSIASIQIGIKWKYIKYVYFIDEKKGNILEKVKLQRLPY